MSKMDSKSTNKRKFSDSPFLSDEELELPSPKILPKEIVEAVLLAIFTQKGGVGKTTSTFNFACLLAKKYNMKVLMVDADPQCNLTAISLKRQILKNSKKNESSDSKKSKSSSASSSKKKPDKEI